MQLVVMIRSIISSLFYSTFYDDEVALAHNGNLTNAKSLRHQLEKAGSVFHSNSDTEILIHLIRQKRDLDFIDALKASLNEVKGGFAFLLLQKERLIAALDPNGFRPLCIGQLKIKPMSLQARPVLWT